MAQNWRRRVKLICELRPWNINEPLRHSAAKPQLKPQNQMNHRDTKSTEKARKQRLTTDYGRSTDGYKKRSRNDPDGNMNRPTTDYLSQCCRIIDVVAGQSSGIQKAAGWFAKTILAGRMVHLFGSGHSRILVEEMWPRYGSFPGFNPIVELSLTFHNLVVGANGQRQAMFLENVSGLAPRILRNFNIKKADSALVISSSGCSIVPIEMAEQFQKMGVRVVAIHSRAHAEATSSKRKDGKKLEDFADMVLDTGAPVGDAMVRVPGLDTPVAPGSTLGGVMLINCIKAELAAKLASAGKPPSVLSSSAIVGKKRSRDLFEAAYDEHAERLAKLFTR